MAISPYLIERQWRQQVIDELSGAVPAPGVFTTLSASGQSTLVTTTVTGLTATQLGTTGVLLSGVYTPTLFNTANISSSTALQCQYMRVGNAITVSGGVSVTPTLLATLTTMGLSLPIASTIGAATNLAGAANSSAVVSASAAIFGDAVNNRATFQMISVGTGSETFYFSFTYLVT